MSDKDNEDIGAIPPIDSDRGDVDLKGKRGKKSSSDFMSALLMFGGAVVLVLCVSGYFLYSALHKNAPVDSGKPVDPTLEKASDSDSGNKGVDKLMSTIAERKKRNRMPLIRRVRMLKISVLLKNRQSRNSSWMN